jgi:uncharacterized protein with PIN domain
VTFLDAYALVALLGEEPAATDVEDLLRAGQSAINAINFAEAIDVLYRIHGFPADEVDAVLEPMLGAPLVVVSCTEQQAWRAAAVRSRYYHRRLRPLSVADCFLLASATGSDVVATADPIVAEVAREERIDLFALADTSGRKPN